MKKALNNIQNIWFKVINDDMTASEAILLFGLLMGISKMLIDVLDPILKS